MAGQSNKKKLSPRKAVTRLVTDPERLEKELRPECSEWFVSLPVVPDGETLSKDGATIAILSAAVHYARELAIYISATESSTINTQLRDMAKLAEAAKRNLIAANDILESINSKINNLEEDAIKRIEALYSQKFCLWNESIGPNFDIASMPFDKVINIYGDIFPTDLDRKISTSEILLYLSSKKHINYIELIEEHKIIKISALATILNKAASLAAPKGGSKNAYLEFNLNPSYQLVEACMTILSAAKLECGSQRKGLLQVMTTKIRSIVDPNCETYTTSYISTLPETDSDMTPLVKGRIHYWKLTLLFEDLKSRPDLDAQRQQCLSELEAAKQEWFVLLSRNARPMRVSRDKGTPVPFEWGPWRNIDEASPFL